MATLQIQLEIMKRNTGMLRSWGLREPSIPALWLLIWDSRLVCVITGDLKLPGSESYSLAYRMLLDFFVIFKHMSLEELWFQF